MNILLLGAGGREHAIAWKLSQSARLKKLFIAPGNAGTKECGENVKLDPNDFDSIGTFCLQNDVAILVVGPEEPLVRGIHDYFLANASLSHIPVIGPKKDGAMLEGSKAFSKDFMQRHSIPTAAYKNFKEGEEKRVLEFLDTLSPPFVLKADGLAAGKGVLILDSKEETLIEVKSMLSGKSFGASGRTIVIEEFLKGIEVSVFVITDGVSYKILPEAKDYKRIGEKDSGPNTGGMGAVSPVAFANAEFMKKVEKQVIAPTMNGLKKENIVYKGFLFFGLINVAGEPFVIEYNCRMGDPETEAVIPRIKTDLVDVFEALGKNKLSEINLEIDPRTVSTVMLVSGGYPDVYEKNIPITGFDKTENCLIFHAGTKEDEDGNILTNGGRVLAITSYGNTIAEAIENANENAERINFRKKYFRKDIGLDLMKIT